MNPEDIKLTTRQKVVPLIKAIHAEFPIQYFLYAPVVLSAGWFVPVWLSEHKEPTTPFSILDRIGSGFLSMIIVGIILFLTHVFLMAFIIPSIKNIKENYEHSSLEAKKKILDNIIEDEVLND